MSKTHKLKDINKYEEQWQRRCYHISGNGVEYIHCCEICFNTNDIKRIPGGHYVCIDCKKKLKLPKEKTIINIGNGLLEIDKKYKTGMHPSDPSKNNRREAWRRVIRNDYMIELFNNNFKYRY